MLRVGTDLNSMLFYARNGKKGVALVLNAKTMNETMSLNKYCNDP
mgnify:CR=1 FL=1